MADAPDFVPSAQMGAHEDYSQDGHRGKGRKGRKGHQGADAGYMMVDEVIPQQITTVVISGIPSHHTPETFRQQLDASGLLGTYDFFFMPTERQEELGGGFAFINFIDPTFASLCLWLFQQYQLEGNAEANDVQGLDNNIAHWSQVCNAEMGEDANGAPLVILTPINTQWAMNGLNTMLNSKFSPQIREQFHKTKLCVFNKKNKCALGAYCPFAHTKEELQEAPDLTKTKLCYNFFRRRCHDTRCKFAHGYSELRATTKVYKTELCRWWSYGGCKAGSSCRYAHGVEELRGSQFSDMTGGMQYQLPPEYMDMDGEANQWQEWQQQLASAAEQEGEGGQLDTGAAGEEQGNSKGSQEEPGEKVPVEEAAEEKALEVEGDLQPRSDTFFSDMGLSEVSAPCGAALRRQQTAPPMSSNLTQLDRLANSDIVLRVKGTFMEAVRLMPDPVAPMQRSWSDGDLPHLAEVMDEEG